jgi:hypothetical protein
MVDLGSLEEVNADSDADTMATHVQSQMKEMKLIINVSFVDSTGSIVPVAPGSPPFSPLGSNHFPVVLIGPVVAIGCGAVLARRVEMDFNNGAFSTSSRENPYLVESDFSQNARSSLKSLREDSVHSLYESYHPDLLKKPGTLKFHNSSGSPQPWSNSLPVV